MRRLTLLLIIWLAVSGPGAKAFQTDPREEMNQGVRAFRTGQYDVALEHFKRAVDLDPKLTMARLYLATAYAQRYIPDAESEENARMGEAAVGEFKRVLEQEPGNIPSVTALASLYFNMKKLDDSRQWYQKLSELAPQNPAAYYSLGVIDWTETYRPRMALKARLGLHPNSPITNDSERAALCGNNLPKVEEGLRMLNRALELRPDYDDAMTYMNLMYREKADCESDAGLRTEDLKQADQWIAKTLETMRAKAQANSPLSPSSAPPPPPPPPPANPNIKRVRVGGGVQEGRLAQKVDPVYPPLAAQVRIQGTVRLEALIGVGGNVEELKVISGHPLLVQAALDAVRQWRYQPTLLNGEPVEVATTIDVPFTLWR